MTSPSTSPSPPRPRGRFGLGALIAAAAVAAALAAGGTLLVSGLGALDGGAGGASAGAPAAQPETLYQCPMHPTVVKNHPGDCPICGMKLVKVEPPAGSATTAAGGGATSHERRVVHYRSPMNPAQTSPTPMKDDMGMDYLPVYSDEVGGDSAVPGLATVAIDPARQQLIGLRTATVRHGVVGGAWRTVGRVGVDETRVRHINVKTPGYVERIFVDFVGRPVGRGEPLFAMYSPELVAAQDELLLAARTERKLAGTRPLGQDGAALLAAARRKLALWDVPAAEIARIERTGEPMKALTFVSPIKGS
jgi:Cu(I)/Ag(I) efflux system membrane fusion protein